MAMISKKIENLLNDQIMKELFSVNLYLSISSYFMDLELDGFANFFREQAQEETMHAMKQFDYIHQVDGKVTMGIIEAPKTEFGSIMEALKVSLNHEQEVTAAIHNIVKEAMAESDFATHTFLQWFVTEQVEEEGLLRNLLKKMEMVGDNSSALYLLNEELGRRKADLAV